MSMRPSLTNRWQLLCYRLLYQQASRKSVPASTASSKTRNERRMFLLNTTGGFEQGRNWQRLPGCVAPNTALTLRYRTWVRSVQQFDRCIIIPSSIWAQKVAGSVGTGWFLGVLFCFLRCSLNSGHAGRWKNKHILNSVRCGELLQPFPVISTPISGSEPYHSPVSLAFENWMGLIKRPQYVNVFLQHNNMHH